MSKWGAEPWYGVDFDGTLWNTDTGEPIAPMVERVRAWLAAGRVVKIVTARAAESFPDRERHVLEVYDFCVRNFGCSLPIQCHKDGGMVELWDDRGVGVATNTGEAVFELLNRMSDRAEKLAGELETAREALRRIAEHEGDDAIDDSANSRRYVDEWSQAAAFGECREIASKALGVHQP